MGTTFKYAPRRWSGESGDDPPGDDDRPTHSVAAEDIFDDPNILSELNEANASLAAARGDVPRLLASPRLPSVDAFDFEEACRAKSLAHKFGPQDPPPDRRRWRFAVPRNGQRRDATPAWSSVQNDAPPRRGGRRAFFWGFCTSLAIVVAAPVVLGIVRSPDAAPPASAGDVRKDIGNEPGAGLAAQGVPPAGIAAAGAPSNSTVVVRKQPAAAAIIAPATTAFAGPLIRPAAIEDRPTVGELSEPSGATPQPVAGLVDGSPPAPEPADDRASEPAVSPPEPADAAPPDDDFTRLAQSQLSAKADPSQTEALEEEALLPPADEAGSPSLSSEQIDRLLARGEDLLRSGDIASARLLFLHVAATGDRRGAKAVGMTYDPNVYARLPVMGLTPDPEQAQLWYGKAGGDLAYTIDLTSPDPAAPVVESEESAEEEELSQWNAACARKYKSFEPSTGLYTGLSGTKRRCQLP